MNIDVDVLREKLGFSDNCVKCTQNTRKCQYDSHFSLMDFCEMLDMAIEEIAKEQNNSTKSSSSESPNS